MPSESELCVDELMVRLGRVDSLAKRFDQQQEDTKLLQEARDCVVDSQNFIHTNKPLIPQYCLKKFADALKKLETLVDQPNKSKVQFKFKKSTPTKVVKTDHCSPPQEESPVDKLTNRQQQALGFQDKTNETLILESKQVEASDVSLINLEKCQVKIIGFANTVYIRNLRDSSVQICIACRAITVTNCTNCHFMFACQQLRIDSTTRTQFEVFTSARSMLESSSELTFRRLRVENLDCDLAEAKGLFTRAGFVDTENNWRAIDDFDWLSPNSSSKNYTVIQD